MAPLGLDTHSSTAKTRLCTHAAASLLHILPRNMASAGSPPEKPLALEEHSEDAGTAATTLSIGGDNEATTTTTVAAAAGDTSASTLRVGSRIEWRLPPADVIRLEQVDGEEGDATATVQRLVFFPR